MADLTRLDPVQWEALCDGCARCCLVKLEDEDSGQLYYTNVACRFLDLESCRCTVYDERKARNPQCMVLDASAQTLELLPRTCAYRLYDEDRELDVDSSELPVRGRVVSEEFIHPEQLPDHLVDWIET